TGLRIGRDLAGIGENRFGPVLLFEYELERFAIELGAELPGEIADGPVEFLESALACLPADDVAGGIDQYERGPGLDAVGVPDGEVAVIDDRVFEVVPQDRLANVIGLLLGRKL